MPFDKLPLRAGPYRSHLRRQIEEGLRSCYMERTLVSELAHTHTLASARRTCVRECVCACARV